MAIAQPHSSLRGAALEDAFIKPNRLFEIAETPERRRLEIPVTKLLRLVREYLIKQFHRFGGAPHAAEHERKVRLRRRPAGRELDRAAEQILGVAPASDPPSKLGEHPDRRCVERVFLEVRFQDALGDVEAVFIERHRRLDEARVQAGADRRMGRHGLTVACAAARRYARHA